MAHALNTCLDYHLGQDPNIILLGQDIGKCGGVFRITDNLITKYGSKRIIDTPLAESAIAGIAIGMATQGLKPIAEFQFMGFIYSAFEQIISHASRMRNRTNGTINLPMVMRAPYGGGIHAPEHHSESTEALFAHVPGLRVVIPSCPYTAYGLLSSAIADPDPVLFLEPKRIYQARQGTMPPPGLALPLDQARIVTNGADLTIVSWGASLTEVIKAQKLSNCQTEIIDLQTIYPLDIETIAKSVSKTKRLLVVHEATKTCGVGAEICAEIATRCFFDLVAPPQRLTGLDTIFPPATLEASFLPNPTKIIAAIENLMEYT